MACRADAVKPEALEERYKHLLGEFILARRVEERAQLLPLLNLCRGKRPGTLRQV